MQSEHQHQPDAAPILQQSHRMALLGSLDDEPAVITCMQCGSTGQTFTYKVCKLHKQTRYTALIRLLHGTYSAISVRCAGYFVCYGELPMTFLNVGSACAGKRVLCVLQRHLMPATGLLALHVDAFLHEAVQGHCAQM